jgi:hypothetical protein
VGVDSGALFLYIPYYAKPSEISADRNNVTVRMLRSRDLPKLQDLPRGKANHSACLGVSMRDMRRSEYSMIGASNPHLRGTSGTFRYRIFDISFAVRRISRNTVTGEIGFSPKIIVFKLLTLASGHTSPIIASGILNPALAYLPCSRALHVKCRFLPEDLITPPNIGA